jgi:regulator of protease activity HflC (stomatin/prohibitin superfamily)
MEPNKALPIVLAIILAVAGGIVWLAGSENPSTPAGYVGYVTRGAVFGKATFVGMQTGPTSYGRGWMLNDAINVSVTPTTITEAFEGDSSVLSRDQLKLRFQVHVLYRIDPSRVKDLVERYSTLHESKEHGVEQVAFEQFIREPLRTEARAAVEPYKALDVVQNLERIGAQLTQWTVAYCKDSPFTILRVVVGNLQYPKEVADAVALKLSSSQDLERAAIEVQIENKKAERRVAEAKGIADATEIIQRRLTPLYVQHEAIEAQRLMANGTNHTVVYIPVGAGGVPLVKTVE